MGQRVPLRVMTLACAGALALAGCGKRGPLELPDGTAAPSPQAVAAEQVRQDRMLQTADQPGLIQSPNQINEQSAAAKLAAQKAAPPPPINAPPAPRRNTFALDPLL